MTARDRILVVEDDPDQLEQLAGFLRGLDVDVETASTVDAARAALDGPPADAAGRDDTAWRAFDIVVTDLRLPGGSGLDLLRWARTRHPQTDFLVMTAFATVDVAVEAMRIGAHDFLTKPLRLDVLEQRLRRLLERRLLDREVRGLRERLAGSGPPPDVVAESPSMRRVFELARRVAPTDSTVLVTGETGVGKEVVAQWIHDGSSRRDGPFVRVNCAALPESLLESELFGHVRGAFTGAERDRKGLFAEADGGSLLLDEIGEVPPSVQVRLLRVLQEREVVPVGETRPRKVDVRILAATNRDLEAECAAGRFRRDLLYRLAVITIAIPPLRERPEDVEALLPRLLVRCAREAGVALPRLSPEAHALLSAHPWPGNVRELINAVQRGVVMATHGVVRPEDLPQAVQEAPAARGRAPDAEPGGLGAGRSLPDAVEALERRAIADALAAHDGVRTRAARALGIQERVLRYKLQLYGIDPTKTSNPRRERRDPGSDGA